MVDLRAIARNVNTVARRTYSIRNCGGCGLPSFIPFPQTAGSATCPGCTNPAAYETGSALAVYYRLNSHLDMLSDQGVLPHLLTIAALRRHGATAHFLPGIDVWFSQDDSDKAEADIFGVWDGKVLCGEVKTSASEFTPDQIARDVSLSAGSKPTRISSPPPTASPTMSSRRQDSSAKPAGSASSC